jgi:pentatricopeptide repeat protein
MHKFQESVPNKKLRMDQEKRLLVPIGSNNLKTGMKIQVMPELLQKDSILTVKHKQELVMFRSGKLLLSNRALAKLVNGYRRHGRTTDLSKLLLCMQQDFHVLGQSSFCSDVIDACIRLGWLEMAHDILDDMDAAGAPIGSTLHMALLTAYYCREMFKEAKALLRKMRKAGFVVNLSDEMVATACLSEAANNASSSSSKSDLIDFLVREMREEEKAIPSVVYELNSSIYYFCKAKMMEDALKTYKRMQHMKIQPTVQTFSYLIDGFSSLGMYRDITILWGDIKRNVGSKDLEVSRDLYEVLHLNFLRGGYFERAMEVIGYMKERNMYCDKWMYKDEFLKLHKNLYRSLKASEARTEAQSKRLEHVKAFRKWVGID